MKRITHIITGLKRGGAETVLFRLTTHLKGFHHEVISLAGPGEVGEDLRSQGIPVHTPSLWQVPKTLKQTQPDIVQTWMYHGDLIGGLAARIMSTAPILWNIRNSTLSPQHTKWLTRGVVKVCAKLSRFLPTRIVTCSQTAREVHEALGYDSQKFCVIPNGIDTDLFSPDPQVRQKLRSELKLGEGPVIGMVARHDPQKDHQTLFKALTKLPSAQLILIGPGCVPENQELVQEIAKLNLSSRVHLLGSRKDIPALLNALDLFVLSSAYGEGFPNALAEAMSCDIPCVATDVGDSGFLMGPTGHLVPPQDSEALAQACLAGLENPLKGQRQRILDLFSLKTMMKSYKDLYLSLKESR